MSQWVLKGFRFAGLFLLQGRKTSPETKQALQARTAKNDVSAKLAFCLHFVKVRNNVTQKAQKAQKTILTRCDCGIINNGLNGLYGYSKIFLPRIARIARIDDEILPRISRISRIFRTKRWNCSVGFAIRQH